MAPAAVLDGSIDDALPLLPIAPVGWLSEENAPLPADTTASYAIAWTPSEVYVAIDVTDPHRQPPVASCAAYWGDGVEVYLDADALYANAPFYDAPGTRQFIARAPADDTTSVTDGEMYADRMYIAAWPSGFATFPRAGGYVLEARFGASELGLPSWQMAAGARIGFDLGINVSAPPGTVLTGCNGDSRRLGQYFLRIAPNPTGSPFQDVTAFCTPMLVD